MIKSLVQVTYNSVSLRVREDLPKTCLHPLYYEQQQQQSSIITIHSGSSSSSNLFILKTKLKTMFEEG